MNLNVRCGDNNMSLSPEKNISGSAKETSVSISLMKQMSEDEKVLRTNFMNFMLTPANTDGSGQVNNDIDNHLFNNNMANDDTNSRNSWQIEFDSGSRLDDESESEYESDEDAKLEEVGDDELYETSY